MRGLAVLLLGLASVIFIAWPQNDLIANIIGMAAIAAVCLSAILGLLIRLTLIRHLTLQHSFVGNETFAKRKIPSQLRLTKSGVPPFFGVEVAYRFKQKPVHWRRHFYNGAEPINRTRYLSGEVVFPHRGLWELDGFLLSLKDALGLCSYDWAYQTKSSIEVFAPPVEIDPLPVMASSAKSGDQLSLSRERSGDLFDLKQYDPSDGTKRILWKAFARSRQLVVRRPEPAVMPEGELAIYLVADRFQDFIAAAVQSYIKQLLANDIAVLFGTDGADGIKIRPEEMNTAINASVWHPSAGSGKEFENYLQALETTFSDVNRVVVFISEGFSNRSSMESAASSRGILCSFVVVPSKILGRGPTSAIPLGSLNFSLNPSDSQTIFCQPREIDSSYEMAGTHQVGPVF
ncbi:hypothetical protein BVY02_00005 [bacterium J17]|nr:hypothetical protein BVY02_00005 [bacterium J17]